jgi:hypothetical protein
VRAIPASCGGVGDGCGGGRLGLIGLGLADWGQVPQRGQDEDGDPGQHQSGDRGDSVQPAGEGLPGDRQQRRGQLVRERSGRGGGAGEAVAGGGGLRRWDNGREVVGELGAVDSGADAAQDRDAQRVAKLVAGLGNARRRPGLLVVLYIERVITYLYFAPTVLSWQDTTPALLDEVSRWMRLDLARSPVDWFLLAVLMFVVAYPRVRPSARPAAARTTSPQVAACNAR